MICFKHKIENLPVKFRKKIEKMWTIITHCMLWLLVTECIVAKHDCDWVKIIYQKMDGDISLNRQENCCKMLGVRCDYGQVIGIHWGYQDLSGYIPPEIGNLINLEML